MQSIALDHVQIAAPIGGESDARRFYGHPRVLHRRPMGQPGRIAREQLWL